MSEVTVRGYEPGDEDAIRRTFAKVFGFDRSPEAWNWAFRQNPAGTRVHLAIAEDASVVSQFCSIPRRLKVGGSEATFGEIVDSMTDPDFRGALKKPGWFARTCQAYVDTYGHPERDAIMYGLPLPVAYRIGRRLLGYVHLDMLTLHERDLSEAPTEAPERPFTPVERFGESATALWSRIEDRYDVSVVRDGSYLDWRYTDRPEVPYERLRISDDGEHTQAIAVLRYDWPDPGACGIAELIMEGLGPEAAAVTRALEHHAASRGAKQLRMHVRRGGPEAAGLATLGWKETESDWRLVGRTFDPERLPLEGLAERWSRSLGDFDVI